MGRAKELRAPVFILKKLAKLMAGTFYEQLHEIADAHNKAWQSAMSD